MAKARHYPGNSDGFVLSKLFAALKTEFVIDITAGSSTKIVLCPESGIRVLGLDLKNGFNALKELVLARAREADDLTWRSSSLPGPSAIAITPRISRTVLFLDKLHVLLLNQREATRAGGHYVTLIGDRRKGGRYSSYQADLITRMPRDELRSVVIKTQHNWSW